VLDLRWIVAMFLDYLNALENQKAG